MFLTTEFSKLVYLIKVRKQRQMNFSSLSFLNIAFLFYKSVRDNLQDGIYTEQTVT